MVLTFSLLLSAYLIGFALYIVYLPKPFTTIGPQVQGLAVFTGGFGRVDAALEAIHKGFRGPILISGLHPQTKLADITRMAGPNLNLTQAQRNQLTLDNAQTTYQNTRSLQTWANHHHLQHIGVITSTYHAARVRVLAYWHAPNLTVTLLPVQPTNAGLHLLFQEYNKLLVALFLY